jgi:hypothetical protein
MRGFQACGGAPVITYGAGNASLAEGVHVLLNTGIGLGREWGGGTDACNEGKTSVFFDKNMNITYIGYGPVC